MKKIKTLAVMSAAAALMTGMATTALAAPVTVTSPGNSTTASTLRNGWVSEQSGTGTVWYYYANGVRYRNQWVKSNDIWYYMDSNGEMVTGWQTIGGIDYYFDTSGAMATGWRKLSASDISASTSFGPMSSSSSSGSNWYYFATSTTGKGFTEGEMVQGWLQLGDKWYYLSDNDVASEDNEFEYGQMVYGEVEIDGYQYYFGKENEGVMRTGFVKGSELGNTSTSSNRPGASTSSDTEGTYYFGTGSNDLGVKKVDSWLNLDGSWYFFDEEGKMVTGHMATDSRGRGVDYDSGDASYYYYMDPSTGKMQTGWVTIKDGDSVSSGPLGSSSSGKYYQYYDNGGSMHFGWLNTGGKWYYLVRQDDLDENTFDGYVLGQMATGYIEVDKDGFYLNNSGVMVTSSWEEVDGEERYFGSNGAMLKSSDTSNLQYVKKSGRIYPVDTDGSLLDEGTTVYYNGSRYSLDEPSNLKRTYEVNSKGYLVEK